MIRSAEIILDPRLRQRRVEIQRQQARRRMRSLAAVVAVAVLAGGGYAATRSPLLDVDRIAVLGSPHTRSGVILRTAGLARRQALVDIDEAGAARSLLRSPWVKRAEVRRQWPDQVVVRVSERQPVAVVEPGAGSKVLVDGAGRILGPAPSGVALPAIVGLVAVGPAGSQLPPAFLDALAVAAALPATLLSGVSGVTPAPGGGVELRLRQGGIVRFGRASQIGEKLVSVGSVLRQVDAGDLAVLDVRIPEAPVLTRRVTAGKVSTEAGA